MRYTLDKDFQDKSNNGNNLVPQQAARTFKFYDQAERPLVLIELHDRSHWRVGGYSGWSYKKVKR